MLLKRARRVVDAHEAALLKGVPETLRPHGVAGAECAVARSAVRPPRRDTEGGEGQSMQTRALIAYAGRGVARPRYYANDHSRDVLDIAPVAMDIADARARAPTLDDAGFTLVAHPVRSPTSPIARRSKPSTAPRSSISSAELSGADLVLVNSPGIRRFSERSAPLRRARQLAPGALCARRRQ